MNEEIPKEKKFLFNYFKNPIQDAFIRYLIFFENYDNFRDHTGYMCQDRWLKQLFSKYNKLIYLYNTFKKEMNLEKLSKLDSGKIKIKSI